MCGCSMNLFIDAGILSVFFSISPGNFWHVMFHICHYWPLSWCFRRTIQKDCQKLLPIPLVSLEPIFAYVELSVKELFFFRFVTLCTSTLGSIAILVATYSVWDLEIFLKFSIISSSFEEPALSAIVSLYSWHPHFLIIYEYSRQHLLVCTGNLFPYFSSTQ